MTNNFLKRALFLAVLGALAGCSAGPRQIRLEPPTLLVESLRVDDDLVHFRLLVHNRNDHDLYLESAAMAMRVDDTELFNAAWELDLKISPRGRELVSLDAPAMPIAAEILLTLAQSRGANVRFELSSEISIEGQRDAKIGQEGFLYPVPGQPGHFR
ncbi:MAG: hypothetical protein WD397_00770 [Wenzhouxiangellaceae bacterium]